MTEKDFLIRRANLNSRLYAALNAHCKLTAKARIREISRLTEEFNGTPYEYTYNNLIAEYGL